MSARWIDAIDRVPASRLAVSDGTEALTYGALRQQARRHATSLAGCHGTGRCLIIRASSSTAFIRTLLATMWSGNIPVPVDPSLPQGALDYIREKSQAAGILAPLDEPDAGLTETDFYDPARPALVVFTSGTSGFPKGVTVSDGNLDHSCRTVARYLDYHTHDSAAVVLPLYYSYALISQVLCQLSIGGRSRIVSDLRNPLKLAAAAEAEQLETFCGVPSTYHTLRAFHALRPLSLPSIRVLCSAGAAMEPTLMSSVREIFPNARFFNNYGMTEASPRIAFIRDDDPRFSEPTCGRPMDGVEVKVIDPETEAELPDGQPGMLVVRGPNITSGYLNDPERTARAFTSRGFLKSGDVAYLDRGYIFIQGRLDDMFNCGGEKVSPLEIERALNSCPGVEASGVTGLEDPQRGMVPIAFLKVSRELRRQDVVAHLGPLLIRSKIPMRYFAVTAFPTTTNGKLQRKRLSIDDSNVAGELT